MFFLFIPFNFFTLIMIQRPQFKSSQFFSKKRKGRIKGSSNATSLRSDAIVGLRVMLSAKLSIDVLQSVKRSMQYLLARKSKI